MTEQPPVENTRTLLHFIDGSVAYAGHYLHGMLGMTGFRLVNAPTFLPAYLHAVSGSNAAARGRFVTG